MKHIKISEEQDRIITEYIKEQLNGKKPMALVPVVDPNGTGDIASQSKEAFNDLNQNPDAKKLVDSGKYPIETKATAPDGSKCNVLIQKNNTQESFLITKKQLSEMKLKNLKKGSEKIKVKNLFR